MGSVYFYNSHTNAIAVGDSNPFDAIGYANYIALESELHLGIGLHGPYNTLQDLYAAWPHAKATNAKPIPGTDTLNSSSPGGIAKGITKAIEAPFSGIKAIGDFFNKLSEANTWLRIGEGLLGIVLIGVALAKLTGADNYITKAAVTAAKTIK